MQRDPLRALVVIPTSRDRANLPAIVERTLRATDDEVHVLVVDDHSSDGTGDVADELALYRPRMHVLHRAERGGLGPTALAGFDWAARHGFGAVAEMAADGSHAPEELPALLAALTHHDLVLASRWVPGAGTVRGPRWRRWLTRAVNRFIRSALGIDVRDATGGFRVHRTDAFARIDLRGVTARGACFHVDLLRKALAGGLAVTEVPTALGGRPFTA